MDDLEICSLAARPDLAERFWEVEGGWPEFMLHDPVAATRYEAAVGLYPDLHLVVLADDVIVARLHAVPIPRSAVAELPDRGWDWALESAVDRPRDNRDAISLIEARVDLSYRDRGLSGVLLAVARESFAELGCTDLVGPVRPNGKVAEPRTPIDEYVGREREDGLPEDHWLRVHIRLGGRIVRVAPLSMTIPGTLTQWRAWTGLRFDTDGLVDVPGGLVPVLVDTAQAHAVYVEPNVWVHHRLR